MSGSTERSINCRSKTTADHWLVCDSKSYPGLKFYVNKLTGIKVWNITDSEIALAERADKGGNEPHNRPMGSPIDTKIYNKQIINNQFSNQLPNVIMNTVPVASQSHVQVWDTQNLPLQQQYYTIIPTALVPFINMPNTTMQGSPFTRQYAQNQSPYKRNKSANYRRNKWFKSQGQNMTPHNNYIHTNSTDLRSRLVRRKSFNIDRGVDEEYNILESNTRSNQNTRSDQINLTPNEESINSGYIVVEMDIILKNYTYLNDVTTSGHHAYKLLVPHHVMAELRDFVFQSGDVQARRILRFLTQQIESGSAKIGEEVPGENRSLMTMQTCSNLVSQNKRVMLITSDPTYEKDIKSFQVFTMQEFKAVFAVESQKHRTPSPTLAVKITVPNNIRKRRATFDDVLVTNNDQNDSDSSRFREVHVSNENIMESSYENDSRTVNDNEHMNYEAHESECTEFAIDDIPERITQDVPANDSENVQLSIPNVDYSKQEATLSNILAHRRTLKFPPVNTKSKTDEHRLNESNLQSSDSTTLSENHKRKRVTVGINCTNDLKTYKIKQLSKPNEDKNKQCVNPALPKVALRIEDNLKTGHGSPRKIVCKDSNALSETNTRLNTPTNAVKVKNNQLLSSNKNESLGEVGPTDNKHSLSSPKAVRSPTGYTATVQSASHDLPETTAKTNLDSNIACDFSPSKSSSTTIMSLDTVRMKKIISMKSLPNPRIPLPRSREFTNIHVPHNKPASRETSYESSSETSVRNKNLSENVIVEETSTSAISNSSYSSKGTNSSKTAKKIAPRSAVMYPIAGQSMEDVLKTRCEEWVFTFVNIMEEILRVKLQEKLQHENTEYPAPRNLREAASSILKKYSDCHHFNVVDAAYKLLSILHNTSDDDGKIVNIQPSEYMEMYSYGVLLVETFLDMSENCKEPSCKRNKTLVRSDEKESCSCFEVVAASESLKKLLYDIQNAKLETFVDPPDHGLDTSFDCGIMDDDYDVVDVKTDVPPQVFEDERHYEQEIPSDRYELDNFHGDDTRYEDEFLCSDDNQHLNRDVMFGEESQHYEENILNVDESQRYEENILDDEENLHYEEILNDEENRRYEENVLNDEEIQHYDDDMNDDAGLHYDQRVDEDDLNYQKDDNNQRYDDDMMNDDVNLGYEQNIEHGDASFGYDQNKTHDTSDKQDKIRYDDSQSYEQQETQSTDKVYNLRSRQSQKHLPEDIEQKTTHASSDNCTKSTFFDSLQLKKTFCTSTLDGTDTKNADKQNIITNTVPSPAKSKPPKQSPNKPAQETDTSSLTNLKIHFTKEALTSTSHIKSKVIRNFTVNAEFEKKMKAKRLHNVYEDYMNVVEEMPVAEENQRVDENKEKANEKFMSFMGRLSWRLGNIFEQVNSLCNEYVKEATSTPEQCESTHQKRVLLCKVEKASHLIENIHNTLESISDRESQDDNNIKMLLKLANVNDYIPDSKVCLEYRPMIAKCKESTKVIHKAVQDILAKVGQCL